MTVAVEQLIINTEKGLKDKNKVPSYQKNEGPSLEEEMLPDNFNIVQKMSKA